MWEWISSLGSLPVFLAIGIAGFLFLTVSFLFGELFEQLEIGEEVETDLSDAGPSVLSLRTVSIFLTALGGIGAITQLRGYGPVVSSLTGAAGGVVLAGLVFWYAHFLFRQQASSLIDSADLVGMRAEVVVAIPAQGPGQVRCLIGESLIDKIARASGGQAIPLGAAVRVEAIAGESVLVVPWRSPEAGRGLFDPPPIDDEPIAADRREQGQQ